MKKLILISCLLISFGINSIAQESNFVFGKVEQWERDLVTYDKDKEAEAIVLFDIGNTYFESDDNGYHIVFERKQRIKLLKDAGLNYAEVEIPLYQEGNIYERVTNIQAKTHNFDGGIHTVKDLDAKTCYTEKVNESWANMKFAFPDAKTGSIIEYSYRLESEYIFNLRDWEFQADIPTIYSEYVARLVPFYEFRYILQGANKFDLFESNIDKSRPKYFAGLDYFDMVHKYVMKDVPAFHIEEYVSSRNDYIMKLDFQLAKVTQVNGSEREIMTTWPALSKDLLKHKSFGKFISKCNSGADKVVDINSILLIPDLDKIKVITNSIKDNYTWDKVYGKYANSSLKEILKSKRGNSGDLNLMLIGVLRAAGIDANPVLLSTRNHGKVNIKYPFSHFLNYVVAHVVINGETMLIDVTEPRSAYNILPTRCINDQGLLIKDKEPEWLGIFYSKPSKEQIIINTVFEEDLEKFSSNVKIIATAYDALRMRNSFGEDKEKIAKYYDSDMIKTNKDSILISNYRDKEKALSLSILQSGETEIIGDKIYFSPFLGMVRDENPFKFTSRTYPIEMIYPYTEIYSSRIEIPDGYEIDYTPEAVKYDNSLYGLDFFVSSDDKTVSVAYSFSFKKGTYPSTDYLRLKSHFNRIIECGGERIVFRKIEATVN